MLRGMTPTDLRTLLDYHYWARDRLLAAVEQLTPEQYTRELGSSFGSVRDTLVYTYSAEWAWHSRWRGVSPTAPLSPDDYPDVPTLRHAWQELQRQVYGFLDAIGDDIERMFDYRSLSGVDARSSFSQMVQHVVNHASYHRGQVTTMLRQLGAKPAASMDLIAFYRQRG